MSRRHHGRSHQGGRYRHDPPRPAQGAAPLAPGTASSPPPASIDASADARPAVPDGLAASPANRASEPVDAARANLAPLAGSAGTAPSPAPSAPSTAPTRFARPHADGRPGPAAGPTNANGHANGQSHGPGRSNGPGPTNGQERSNGCTAPQLRRFIKSRPYVPMHELRRRFAIDGGDDEVTQVSINQGHVYVGLPSREGSLLGELLRGGDIGYELSLDPRTPVVIGVYPMRPVPRS
jgi:hypothetical protein